MSTARAYVIGIELNLSDHIRMQPIVDAGGMIWQNGGGGGGGGGIGEEMKARAVAYMDGDSSVLLAEEVTASKKWLERVRASHCFTSILREFNNRDVKVVDDPKFNAIFDGNDTPDQKEYKFADDNFDTARELRRWETSVIADFNNFFDVTQDGTITIKKQKADKGIAKQARAERYAMHDLHTVFLRLQQRDIDPQTMTTVRRMFNSAKTLFD